MPSWSHRVLLNSVDITSKSALGVTVEETENSSSLCDVRYYPASGTQDPDGLLLQSLEVDVDVGSGWETLFDGKVISAIWDPKTRSYAVRGSNRLQEYFRALGTEAAVLSALTGAVYSDAVFGEPPEDLWEYAQRCAETIEKDVHLTRAGSLVLVDWAAKGTADHTLDGDDIHNQGTFQLERPDADELVNEVRFTYEYRVSRHKVRSHSLSWSAWQNNTDIDSFCDWATGPTSVYQFPMPMLPKVQSTMIGGSWNVPAGVVWKTFPKSQPDFCFPGHTWINNEPPDGEVAVTFASALGYKAWAQPLRETYTLTIEAANSKTYYGATVTETKTGSIDVPADPTWPPNAAIAQPTWLTDTIGDYYEDQEDDAARTNDLQCCYQWAGWRIRGAHRAASVVVRTDLRPDITLADTLSISSYGLVAKGKVRRIRYILDGAPYTEVSVAISRGDGGSTDSWSVPSRPDTRDPGYPAPAASQSYQTYVGGWSGAAAAPVPDTRNGWITNVIGGIGQGHEDYSSTFRVQWPEVEDAAAEERLVSVPSTWELAVNHDTLTIS